jgi:hypothetical protein
LAEIRPLPATTPEQANDASTNEGPAGLRIVNEAESRALVCAAGIPVAWIDAHTEGVVTGFAPGRHMIGALRPFGGLGLTRRPIEIPGHVTLRAAR